MTAALVALALLAAPTQDALARLEAARRAEPERAEEWARLARVLGLPGAAAPGGPTLRVESVVELDQGRLVIGVEDPSGLLNRVEVLYEGAEGVMRTLPARPLGAGRKSVLLPLGWPQEGLLVVELGSDLLPGPALWRQPIKAPAAPPRLRAATPLVSATSEEVRARPGPGWVWAAVGVITAGVVAASVWQETR